MSRLQARRFGEGKFLEDYVDELHLKSSSNHYKAIICLCTLSDLKRCWYLERWFHPQEKSYFDTIKFERRKKSYALGRVSAKQAISTFVNEDDPRNILIRSGVFNHPVIDYPGNRNIQVSITHCDNLGASIAFQEILPMGIDIEKINLENQKIISSQLTRGEVTLLEVLPYPHEELLTILWTSKEALSKILKTGLMTPLSVYEIDKIICNGGYYISFFKNFGQYKTLSLKLGDYICSIAYPKNTDMEINLSELQRFADCIQQDHQQCERLTS